MAIQQFMNALRSTLLSAHTHTHTLAAQRDWMLQVYSNRKFSIQKDKVNLKMVQLFKNIAQTRTFVCKLYLKNLHLETHKCTPTYTKQLYSQKNISVFCKMKKFDNISCGKEKEKKRRKKRYQIQKFISCIRSILLIFLYSISFSFELTENVDKN